MKTKIDKEQIILLLKDTDWEIRRLVLDDLRKILDSNSSLANKELVDQIIPLLKDKCWSVRYSATEALRKIFTINKRLVNKELLD